MYESPVLVELGKVGEVTLGSATGDYLDADMPAGTSFSDLTFSG